MNSRYHSKKGDVMASRGKGGRRLVEWGDGVPDYADLIAVLITRPSRNARTPTMPKSHGNGPGDWSAMRSRLSRATTDALLCSSIPRRRYDAVGSIQHRLQTLTQPPTFY